MEYHTIPIIKESYLPGNSAYLYGIAAAEAALDQGTLFNKARLSTVVFQYDSAVFRRKGVDYGVSKQTLSRFVLMNGSLKTVCRRVRAQRIPAFIFTFIIG